MSVVTPSNVAGSSSSGDTANGASSIDHLPKDLQGPVDILMIDNFDSFTYNLYQALSLLSLPSSTSGKPGEASSSTAGPPQEPPSIVVVRNDAITPADFPLLDIKYLIISPGPGHPKTDSGVSREAIRYFAGKIPVLGVCMGLECLVDAYGGDIAYVYIILCVLIVNIDKFIVKICR